MTVLCLPLYYQQEQVWCLPTKEPELTQIWDDYKASWPWGSLVSLHYLSLRYPQIRDPRGTLLQTSSVGAHPSESMWVQLLLIVGFTQIDITFPGEWDNHWGKSLSLNVFLLCLSVGTRTNKKDIVGQGMGLFWPCVWLPPLLALLSLLVPANICNDCFPKSWSDENVFISLLLPQLCL